MKSLTITIIIIASLIVCLVAVQIVLFALRPIIQEETWRIMPKCTNAPIPRIIHQTWKTKDLPPNFARWSKSCKDLAPHFEYKLWTDEDNRNLIKDHYPWFLSTYDGYDKHIKRVDAARYFILHRYGGLYLDLDFMCLRKFDHVLKDGHAVFGYQFRNLKNSGAVANAWMASPPNHPLFHVLIHSLSRRRHKAVLSATGPKYLTAVIREFTKRHANPQVVIHRMPLIYSHQWNDKSKAVETCKRSTDDCKKAFPDSLFSTVWTHTWK